MKVIQFINDENEVAVGIVKNIDVIEVVNTKEDIYSLSLKAINEKTSLRNIISSLSTKEEISYEGLCNNKKLLPPILTKDKKKMLLTGTGLTHLGSGNARNKMHTKKDDTLSDSMKMFNMGLEGGKPKNGCVGVQAEWFYKGDGTTLKNPYADIVSPSFALDGGEEPELVGVYINDDKGNVYRVGFSIANEFSDHVTEKINYLYLAHSKLRESSIGAELFLGEIPNDIKGKVAIRRDNEIIWEKDFLTGENNMSHSIRNLEYHHFKYKLFRQANDVNFHYFGTSVLSFTDGIVVENNDIIEVSANIFTRALKNRIIFDKKELSIKINYI